jgi:HAE1 family hydrophobic/amphiphilic exporter-1
MRMPQYFIDRPIFATVLSLLIVIVGALAYTRLAVSEFPEIAPPSVTVSTSYSGASAETVADTVAAVIEQEVNGVDGMIYMYSQSTSDGAMTLRITFESGTDPDKAQVLVQNRVSAAERRLPEEVRRNGLSVRKNSPDFLMAIHMFSRNGTYDQVYISNYALINVQEELARIEGVGSVGMFGAREYAMRVWLDPTRIAALGLTADEVLAALRGQNVQVAGGAIGEPPQRQSGAFQMPLQLKGRLRETAEFENIIVKAGTDGRTVRVKDIGRVELGALNYGSYGYLDRYPAAVMSLNQTPGTDALSTASKIKAKIAELAKRFPPGLEYDIVYNPTAYIEVSAAELRKTILEAVGLVVLVMLLFLQTWRATVVPMVAIPISLIGTFITMVALGYSLNSLTMFALVLAVGIVVDDAIVVVENIERKLQDGLAPLEAARVSMREVGSAVVAIAVVLVSVFIPSAFIGGVTGAFFRQFAVIITTATVISAFVSLTLSPSLCAILFKSHAEMHGEHRKPSLLMRPVKWVFAQFNRGLHALSEWFAALVLRTTANNILMLGIFAGLICFTIFLVRNTPAGFIPQIDRGIMIVALQLPPGASLERTDQVVKRAVDIALSTPGIAHVAGYSGRNGSTNTAASNGGQMQVILSDYHERVEKGLNITRIQANLRQRLAEIQEATVQVFIPPSVRGIGNQSGFAMRLQDRSNLGPREMVRVSSELITAANDHPSIRNAFTSFQTSTPQMFVDVDRDKAQMLRVPLANIFEAMRIFMGSAYVNDFNMFGRTYRVVAQADGNFRLDPANIGQIRVRSSDGAMVPLGSLVSFKSIVGPERMARFNLFPAVEVNGQGAPGVSSGQVLAIMEEVAAKALPDGVSYEWTDLSYQEKRASKTGYFVFVLSIIFVFLALSALYESWALPLAIVMIVPMCLFAGALGVRIHGQDINILTQIGFVVLIGLAAKNAILIVEFAKQNEERGMDPVSAAVEAARRRLRPILMTSLTFTLGVTPLVLATGAGAEMRISLGTTVFWGMIGVTLFGLLFTPVFYTTIRAWMGAGRKEPSETKPVPLATGAAHPAE